MGASNRPEIVGIFGSTGTGKSTTVKREIRGREPLIVWDLKREYPLKGMYSLADVARAMYGKRCHLAYWPSMDAKLRADQFSQLCDMVYKRGDLTFVVEELAFVTRASWAPDAWRMITLTGRHEGLKVVATSQRPASVDKDFFSNFTRLRTFRMRYPEDARALAGPLGVPMDEILALKVSPRGSQFIEVDELGKLTRGTVRFPTK